MSRCFTSRAGTRLLTAALGLLAAAIFLWGLTYKLSLYDPPQASSHQMFAAKLVSDREGNRVQDQVREHFERPESLSLGGGLALVLLLQAADMLLLLRASASTETLETGSAAPALHLAALPAFGFRPPPSFSL